MLLPLLYGGRSVPGLRMESRGRASLRTVVTGPHSVVFCLGDTAATGRVCTVADIDCSICTMMVCRSDGRWGRLGGLSLNQGRWRSIIDPPRWPARLSSFHAILAPLSLAPVTLNRQALHFSCQNIRFYGARWQSWTSVPSSCGFCKLDIF
jgi:hypothetical protein